MGAEPAFAETRRTATPEERAELERDLRAARRAASQDWYWLLPVWFMLLFLGFLLWALVAWVSGHFLDADFGPRGPWASEIIGFAVAASGLYLGAQAWRDSRHQISAQRLIRDDLASGEVREQALKFADARRFQEPEHLGLVYFLRTPDDRVYVMLDYESQELAEHGDDPLNSRFRPTERLVIRRAAASGVLLASRFSGVELNPGEPVPLTAHARDWPESESFARFPWSELDQRMAPPRRIPRRLARKGAPP